MIKNSLLSIFVILLLSCEDANPKKYKSTNDLFHYQGRTEILNGNSVGLLNSASSVTCNVEGKSVNVYLQSDFKPHNYVAIIINDAYQKRYKITGDTINKITIDLPNKKNNKLEIVKLTESFNGAVKFHGLDAIALNTFSDEKPFKIEFIGDSITCGALADSTDVPCGEGEYLDQHNAYLAYGSRVARALNAEYTLSSVSGIGMYRNWNDENIEEPIMPQVYENLYLNTDTSKPNTFNFNPDLVSICLGTNDMSDGDGTKKRLPFNPEKYTTNYIEFVKTVYKYYPKTKIVLLNSPMVDGDRNKVLISCLENVQTYFKDKNIPIFEFDKLYVTGCSYHPSIAEHKVMAEKLTPFFKTLLNE